MELVVYLIIIGMVCECLVKFAALKGKKKHTTKDIVDALYRQNVLNDMQYNNAHRMPKDTLIKFLNNQIQSMDTAQQEMFMHQMNLNQQEMHRLMSTGIEFGGFNTDINLNPGMLNEQMMQQQMNHMNDSMNLLHNHDQLHNNMNNSFHDSNIL